MTKSNTYRRKTNKRKAITASEWNVLVAEGDVPDTHHKALEALLALLAHLYTVAISVDPKKNPALEKDIKRYSQRAARIEAALELLDYPSGGPPSLLPLIPDLQNQALDEDLESARLTLRFVARADREMARLLSETVEGNPPKDGVVTMLLVFWVSELGRPITDGGTVAKFVYHAAKLILRNGNQQIASAASARAIIERLSPTVVSLLARSAIPA